MQISVFQDIFSCNLVTLSSLKCSTMEERLKVTFSKHPEIRIQTLMIVFSVSKYPLSLGLRIFLSKLVYFKISLIVTK